MSTAWSRTSLLLLLGGGCTGLVAGPESTSVTPIPVSRDSAYARARRALQGESFTMDVVDSVNGVLTGRRWPSPNAQQGSAAACHVTVALQVRGTASQSAITSTSRWVAPRSMSQKAAAVCEQERSEVLDRTAQALVPPPTP
jgi:hypothetical protein